MLRQVFFTDANPVWQGFFCNELHPGADEYFIFMKEMTC